MNFEFGILDFLTHHPTSMATFTKFEELEVWQSARALGQRIFTTIQQSESFAKDFRLKDQINAASGSVMDNIAEGFTRGGNKEFCGFLSIAKSSCAEVQSQLYRALDRQHIGKEDFDELYQEAEWLANKIGGFIKYLRNSELRGVKFKQ